MANPLKNFMNISNASMKVKPYRKDLIARMNKCLNKGGVNFKCFDHYYDRILNMIADEVTVAGGDSKMEERRAVWTTSNNINAWFDNLKQFLLDHKFARESTPEEIEEKKGELHFFDGQIHIIINFLFIQVDNYVNLPIKEM